MNLINQTRWHNVALLPIVRKVLVSYLSMELDYFKFLVSFIPPLIFLNDAQTKATGFFLNTFQFIAP
jgi:hypothetical protein